MNSQKINDLMQQMTTEEKIGQLIQLSADFFQDGQAVITGPMKSTNMTLDTVYTVGSVLGISGAKQVRKIQHDYLQNSRLKIPLLFMADVVHGYQTIFPIPLALGASFNPETMKTAAKVAAQESAAGGVHVTFAPMVDLVRDPRWGRVMESTGEDPYLNSVMADASVRGFQGDKLDDRHVAACVKHFAAYGAPEAGREYNTVDLSEWRFKEQYLPAYQAAIDAQALLVMTSFNTLFGVPATANQHLMRDILRQELKFDGVLISDWDAIAELIHHSVAGDLAGAADIALKAGVDIDMMAFAYAKYLNKAANLDEKTARLIDESVRRVLELKDKLGLFTDPYRGVSEEREQNEIKTAANLADAQKAAEESIVLLKNQHQILPLTTDAKVALVGPAADTGDLLGSWSWQGKTTETATIKEVLSTTISNLDYAKGCDYHALNQHEIELAIAKARQQDVIVAVLGLPSSESGEATSLTNIKIPEEQLVLLRQLAQLNKPIVTVIVAGRPLDLTEVAALSDAIVYAWFPGSKGASAINNVLLGRVNPSGKLPMSFPRSVGQIPIYYNHYQTGRPITNTPADDENKYQSKYIDEANSPLYPFGYGLSYAKLSIESVTVVNTEIHANASILCQVTLKNASNITARTVIETYIHQQVAETVRPVKMLVDFEKISIAANTTQTIEVEVPCSRLATVHSDLRKYVDPGQYTLMIGFDSEQVIKNPITIIK
ncbi:MAG: beta-glucosidase BglX [Lactobacillaceae bacterium]|jgi:beta-glucosidase|nr:beta-glucosidase BglX [Lactobacillaceae bacterium]